MKQWQQLHPELFNKRVINQSEYDGGKPFKVAIVATMRKLLTIANAIIAHTYPMGSP